MLKRMKGKKGFTLAELLIVVAIIAILVAIAVPLFVGSLNKAREARDNANIRAVRGAAVVYLLENEGKEGLWPAAGAENTGWDVTAHITEKGEITTMTVAYKSDITADEAKAETGGFKVTLHLTNTDIKTIGGYTAPAAPAAPGGGD